MAIQVIRKYKNDLKLSEVSGVEEIDIEAGQSLTIVFTHEAGDWSVAPMPVCTWSGDDVEAYLDLGGPFDNTQFTLHVRNVSLYYPTERVRLSYSRKGYSK